MIGNPAGSFKFFFFLSMDGPGDLPAYTAHTYSCKSSTAQQAVLYNELSKYLSVCLGYRYKTPYADSTKVGSGPDSEISKQVTELTLTQVSLMRAEVRKSTRTSRIFAWHANCDIQSTGVDALTYYRHCSCKKIYCSSMFHQEIITRLGNSDIRQQGISDHSISARPALKIEVHILLNRVGKPKLPYEESLRSGSPFFAKSSKTCFKCSRKLTKMQCVCVFKSHIGKAKQIHPGTGFMSSTDHKREYPDILTGASVC